MSLSTTTGPKARVARSLVRAQGQAKGAVFSRDRTHRFVLWRTWNPSIQQRAIFIGLNPSAADENSNDPTIRRCDGFARSWRGRWRCGGFYVVNLYSYCSAYPAQLFAHDESARPNNQHWLQAVCSLDNALLIGMWGNHGRRHQQDQVLLQWLKQQTRVLHCIRANQSGAPSHPLYLPAGLKPQICPQ